MTRRDLYFGFPVIVEARGQSREDQCLVLHLGDIDDPSALVLSAAEARQLAMALTLVAEGVER